jgi:beta-phosphoglucomutase-like phosphatase (HAD superfamily)
MIKYLLYDLDGVLVDACDWHYHSLNYALMESVGYSIPYDEHMSTYNGLPTKTKLLLLSKKGLVDPSLFETIFDRKQYFTKIAIEKYGKIDENKILIHKHTKSLGIQSVCVTNSIRETAELMLNRTGQLDYMNFVVCNEDVSKNKPDPMPFIFAIQKLRANNDECLILEDSDKGIMSASASGAKFHRVKDSSEVILENIQKWLEIHA